MKNTPKIKTLKEEPTKVEYQLNSADDIIKLMKVNLDLAGILFINAHLQIEQGKKEFVKLQKEIEKYKILYNKRLEKYPIDSDNFITYQLDKLRNIEVFYEPVIRHFSTAKILLACCGESYVNEVAGVILNGKVLDEFYDKTIKEKWILIQEHTKVKRRLILGKNPLQGFVKLTKERNDIVHFKGSKKDLDLLEIPNFLDDFKLTPIDCLKNINSVKELIISFSLAWKGSYGPSWLNVATDCYRNPCFYLGSREVPMVLYSDRYDKDRYK